MREFAGGKKTKPTGNDGKNLVSRYCLGRSAIHQTRLVKMGPKTTTDAADKKPKVTKQQENAGT